MNIGAEMGFTFPETKAQRVAGKISFLTRARDAHRRFAADPELKAKDRAWQAELARQADAAITKLKETA